jgi:hypothetical protein
MAFDVLEEEGGAAGRYFGVASEAGFAPQRIRAGGPELTNTVGDFGDFKQG